MPPNNFDARTWNSSESFRSRLNKTDSSYSSFETLSSRSSKVAVMAEEPDGGPAMFTTASTMMTGVSSPQSLIALARTSRLRRC